MNDTPKYVVSRTLEEPLGWNNSTPIEGNLADEITELKPQPNKDVGISGSPTSSGRCCKRTSSTNSGSWSIP
jgi:hypothetical protein